MYSLIDTHAHLEEIPNLEQALSEAKTADITAIIAVGMDYETNQQALDFARTYQGFVYPALGLHPGNLAASELDRNLKFIETHIDKAIAVGEVGLDYHKGIRARADKDLQKHALKEVLKIARAYKKPALIHSRYAWRDALTLVEEAQVEKAIFHWYTGPSSVLRDIIGRGYYISTTPAVEYHEEHRRAIKESPLDKLLLETDSPVTYGRGRDFEFEARPVHILKSLKGAAQLKGMSEAEIAEITTANALNFFSLQR